MRYAGTGPSSLNNPPVLELDDVPGKGNRPPGRPLVPFTVRSLCGVLATARPIVMLFSQRFRRLQPLYSSITVDHESKNASVSPQSDSTFLVDNAPRRKTVHENILPGTLHLLLDEDRKRKVRSGSLTRSIWTFSNRKTFSPHQEIERSEQWRNSNSLSSLQCSFETRRQRIEIEDPPHPWRPVPLNRTRQLPLALMRSPWIRVFASPLEQAPS